MTTTEESQLLLFVTSKVEGDATYGEDLAPRPTRLESFERRAPEIAHSVARVASSFRDQLEASLAKRERLDGAPNEVEIRFGLDVQAESNVIIAKAAAGCSFEVTLRWSADKNR
jgi:hypothetical protein